MALERAVRTIIGVIIILKISEFDIIILKLYYLRILFVFNQFFTQKYI
jgi:hypothetical protein